MGRGFIRSGLLVVRKSMSRLHSNCMFAFLYCRCDVVLICMQLNVHGESEINNSARLSPGDILHARAITVSKQTIRETTVLPMLFIYGYEFKPRGYFHPVENELSYEHTYRYDERVLLINYRSYQTETFEFSFEGKCGLQLMLITTWTNWHTSDIKLLTQLAKLKIASKGSPAAIFLCENRFLNLLEFLPFIRVDFGKQSKQYTTTTIAR